MDGEPAREFRRGQFGKGLLGGGAVIVLDFMEEVGGLATGLPFAETASALVGEVLLQDWPATKVLGEDGLSFGQAIEPGEQGF